MQLGELELETAAREAKGNWRGFDSFAWHNRPDHCEDWAIFYTHHRDSDLLAQSNADAIGEVLAPFTEGEDVRTEHHTHWACGWIDGYAIRVYRNGQITEAFAPTTS